MSEPLVVIGNGAASARFVEELGKQALGRYSVLVIGAEPTPSPITACCCILAALRRVEAGDIS